jgi:hypothetical protein
VRFCLTSLQPTCPRHISRHSTTAGLYSKIDMAFLRPPRHDPFVSHDNRTLLPHKNVRKSFNLFMLSQTSTGRRSYAAQHKQKMISKFDFQKKHCSSRLTKHSHQSLLREVNTRTFFKPNSLWASVASAPNGSSVRASSSTRAHVTLLAMSPLMARDVNK